MGPFEAHPDPELPHTTHFCLPGLGPQLEWTTKVYAEAMDFLDNMLPYEAFPHACHAVVFVGDCKAVLHAVGKPESPTRLA